MNRPNPTIVGFLNKKSLFDTDNEARNVSPIKKHVRANTQ